MSEPKPEKTLSGAARMFGDFAPALVHFTEDVLFGELLKRTELSPKERSLITVAALTTGGNTGQLVYHLGLAKDNGATESELIETITPPGVLRRLAESDVSDECGEAGLRDHEPNELEELIPCEEPSFTGHRTSAAYNDPNQRSSTRPTRSSGSPPPACAAQTCGTTAASQAVVLRARGWIAACWRPTVRRCKSSKTAGAAFGVGPQEAEWDARYSEREGAMWSGRPNGRFMAEASPLTPGRALDVGCGEGADAIWLAEQGWTVTAIDISGVAIGRAQEAAQLARVSIDWVSGDVLENPFPARSFDLVSLQYPALPKAAGDEAVRGLLETVGSGGVLLAVYHDLDDEHREHMKSRGIDPADYVGVDDLVYLLGNDFTVEINSVEPRIDPPPDTPHIADVVLRARRR